METILYSNFHFDGGVELRVSAQCVDHYVQLFNDVIESSDHGSTKKVPAHNMEQTQAEYSPTCCPYKKGKHR